MKEYKNPTIKDLARECNVSTATASKALNNTGRVSDDTRKRVKLIADKIGYTPNVFASSLKAVRTNTIGLCFHNVFSGHFWPEVYKGIDSYCLENNLYPIISNSNNNSDREEEIINKYISMKVDGIIIVPTLQTKKSLYEKLMKTKIPFVFLDSYADINSFDYVGTDNYNSGILLAKYLINKGYKDIAIMLGGHVKWNTSLNNEKVTHDNLGIRPSSILLRYKGFCDELKTHNIIPFIIDEKRDIEPPYIYGYEVTKKNINLFLDKKYSVLVCLTDSHAIGAYRALNEYDIKVGKDLSVTGYNNDPICDFISPRLTTLSQDKFELGVNAIQLLSNKINDPLLKPKKILLQGEIIERDSCNTQK
ncbi:MAG: LacI family DNA-binding transcriptional regulator [Pleomorphochaeta sp.]